MPIRLYEENGFSFLRRKCSRRFGENGLIILNSPANPTGGVVPQAEIEALVKGLEAHPQVAVMSDEIYSRMTYDGLEHVNLLNFPEIRDRLIVLDGWSKTYAMTGWRMGWGLWPEPLVDIATRLCINMHRV